MIQLRHLGVLFRDPAAPDIAYPLEDRFGALFLMRLPLLLCAAAGATLAFAQQPPPTSVNPTGPPPLRVGVEFNTPPLSFLPDPADPASSPTGFTIDLLREIERVSSLRFELVPKPWTRLLADFEAQDLDMLANVLRTDARRDTMAFTNPHGRVHGVIYTRRDRHLSLTDYGPGIEPELLARVFDPYFSTKNRGTQKGMGLGLSISHAIVQEHQGVIMVKSVPDRGTTVHLWFPLARVDAAPPFDFSRPPATAFSPVTTAAAEPVA
jgi:ABC-type amino acid transport substrate-binding protein